MASRKEEKEHLRRERLASQASFSGSERRRLILGYALAGILAAAVIAGLVVAVAGNDDGSGTVGNFETCENGHFQPAAGSPPKLADDKTQVKPDCREGTTPAAIQIGELAAPAK